MYRFSINHHEWILRFSVNVIIEKQERQRICKAIIQMGKELIHYSHGDSFIILDNEQGIIVFNIETIPSFILTVSNVIPKEDWYSYDGFNISQHDGY
ncbi:hypothetical protein [Bacillus sp. CRN 9]|nr:hypothetical protein [Bacillus sp. CRN 9]